MSASVFIITLAQARGPSKSQKTCDNKEITKNNQQMQYKNYADMQKRVATWKLQKPWAGHGLLQDTL